MDSRWETNARNLFSISKHDSKQTCFAQRIGSLIGWNFYFILDLRLILWFGCILTPVLSNSLFIQWLDMPVGMLYFEIFVLNSDIKSKWQGQSEMNEPKMNWSIRCLFLFVTIFSCNGAVPRYFPSLAWVMFVSSKRAIEWLSASNINKICANWGINIHSSPF